MILQHIIPAIIPDTLDRLQQRLREVRGGPLRVQIDVMDGTYTKSTTWPYGTADRDAFEAIRREDDGLPYWQDFDFEIDLLLREPERRIEEWALAGASTLIVHLESTDRIGDIMAQCMERRLEVALALKPATDIKLLAPYVEQLVFVQCMGNDRVGFHGVSLDPAVLDKIRAIHKRWPALPIGVDIGVNEETLPALIEAGATRFAAGSAVFGVGEPLREWHRLETYTRQKLEEQHDVNGGH